MANYNDKDREHSQKKKNLIDRFRRRPDKKKWVEN